MPADNETSAGNRLANLLTNQTVKNSYFSMLDVMLMPVLMLAATPIFLSELGATQYGVWMLVNSIVASIGIADIGAGADGWASGSHAWKGTRAAFSPRPAMKRARANESPMLIPLAAMICEI